MSRRDNIHRYASPASQVAWAALLSAFASGAYGELRHQAPLVGAIAGLANGGLLSFLEVFVLRLWARTALLRLPFAAYFAVRVALYFGAVLAINLVALPLAGDVTALRTVDRSDIEFALAMCVAVNLLFGVDELLGPGVLFAFVAGRYRRPRSEVRALLYIDLRGSTALAERLGEARFLDLLNAFFADVTAEIVAEGGEIHKYVGVGGWRSLA